MAAAKQNKAAKKNIKNAQAARSALSPRVRFLAQPQGKTGTEFGVKREGDYYRIVVRPKEEFVSFRSHDVGRPGHIQRLAGKRASGSWADQAWLVSKEDAHMEKGRLVADSPAAEKIMKTIGPIIWIEGDVFLAHFRKERSRKRERDSRGAERTEGQHRQGPAGAMEPWGQSRTDGRNGELRKPPPTSKPEEVRDERKRP